MGNGLPPFSTLKHCVQVGENVAKSAGKILLDWQSRFTVTEKSRSNLVTEADFSSQQLIVNSLRTHFPDHGLIGEEDELDTSVDSSSEFCWIIDPLDGTGNYVHGMPYFAVSIGLQYKGELVAGIVYDPTRQESFTAFKNGGARLNNKVIHCSQNSPLKNAMCVASLPVDGNPHHPAMARFLKVLPEAQSVQRLGSAALNLAYVACGRIDGFWSQTLKPWDMAAGVVIAREAGAQVTQMDGNTFDVMTPNILATNGTVIHNELIPLVR